MAIGGLVSPPVLLVPGIQVGIGFTPLPLPGGPPPAGDPGPVPTVGPIGEGVACVALHWPRPVRKAKE